MKPLSRRLISVKSDSSCTYAGVSKTEMDYPTQFYGGKYRGISVIADINIEQSRGNIQLQTYDHKVSINMDLTNCQIPLL